MAKSIEPKLRKIGAYLHWKKIRYLRYLNIKDLTLGLLVIAINYGRI